MITQFIARIENFLATQSRTKFKQLVLGYIGGFSLLLVGIGYYRHHSLQALVRQLQTLNKKRLQVTEVLSEELTIQAQQLKVLELLAKDPNFFFRQYLEQLLSELNLSDHLLDDEHDTHVTETEPEALKSKQLSEVTLETKLQGLNMEQVTQLLTAIEQNKRVYLKTIELEATKDVPPTVHLTLVMGTLSRKTEGGA